jgi:predicted phosphoribosyltransferase
VVVDDGAATGATMMAALVTLRAQQPAELIVALPVATRDCLAMLAEHCDEVMCLVVPWKFWSVGQFYKSFPPVEDGELVAYLKHTRLDEFGRRAKRAAVDSQDANK